MTCMLMSTLQPGYCRWVVRRTASRPGSSTSACGGKRVVPHVQGHQLIYSSRIQAAYPPECRPEVAKGIALQLRAHLMMRAAGSGRHASDAGRQSCWSRQWKSQRARARHPAGDAYAAI